MKSLFKLTLLLGLLLINIFPLQAQAPAADTQKECVVTIQRDTYTQHKKEIDTIIQEAGGAVVSVKIDQVGITFPHFSEAALSIVETEAKIMQAGKGAENQKSLEMKVWLKNIGFYYLIYAFTVLLGYYVWKMYLKRLPLTSLIKRER